MLRLFGITIAWLGVLTGSQAQESPKPGPIVAKRVQTTETTLASAISAIAKQSGIEFDLSAVDVAAKVEPVPATDFWLALESLARQTGTRFGSNAGKVRFAKGPAAPSSVDGPFRVSVKQVTAKRDFDTESTHYDVLLEVTWEPRFPVYLMDDAPKITAASAGKVALTAGPNGGRVPTLGYRQLATVHLSGIPRSAATIDVLAGSFNVVASEKIWAVEFNDLTGDKAVSQSKDGVKATLQPVKRATKSAQFDFNLEYPPSHPEFESFEQWASANRLRLYPPNAPKGFEPTDYNTNEAGRRIAASYSYEAPAGKAAPFADLKGWRAVYETSGPMVTQTVKFELKGIALP